MQIFIMADDEDIKNVYNYSFTSQLLLAYKQNFCKVLLRKCKF